MNIEEVREYCLSKPLATEDMPFGIDYVVFRVADKIFAGINLETGNYLTLKCNPEKFDDIVGQHSEIEQAWHWHKKHWIQMDFESCTLSDAYVRTLIDDAYAHVVSKLPKKRRAELGI